MTEVPAGDTAEEANSAESTSFISWEDVGRIIVSASIFGILLYAVYIFGGVQHDREYANKTYGQIKYQTAGVGSAVKLHLNLVDDMIDAVKPLAEPKFESDRLLHGAFLRLQNAYTDYSRAIFGPFPLFMRLVEDADTGNELRIRLQEFDVAQVAFSEFLTQYPDMVPLLATYSTLVKQSQVSREAVTAQITDLNAKVLTYNEMFDSKITGLVLQVFGHRRLHTL